MSATSGTGRIFSLRVIVYSRLIFAGYLALGLALHIMAAGQAADGQAPMVTDFNTFYAASLMTRRGDAAAVYDRAAMHEAERDAMGKAYPALDRRQLDEVPQFRWFYPPPMLLAVTPLSILPYWLAYGLWDAAGLGLFVYAVRCILAGPAATAVALAMPATFVNAMFGQTGFFVAGIAGLGLSKLQSRPLLAGTLLGTLVIKPHFAVLLPLALVAGGHWRALAAATLAGLALAALSLAAFGDAPWMAFVTQGGDAALVLQAGGVPWVLMPTLWPSLRLLGIDADIAMGAQLLASLLAAGAVIWCWRRAVPLAIKASVLCLATFLALPFAHAYDLVLLALPLFWLAALGVCRGWILAATILAGLLPLLGPGLAKLGMPVAPAVIAWQLLLLLRLSGSGQVSTDPAANLCNPRGGQKPPGRP